MDGLKKTQETQKSTVESSQPLVTGSTELLVGNSWSRLNKTASLCDGLAYDRATANQLECKPRHIDGPRTK